jgi:hypothetical protein
MVSHARTELQDQGGEGSLPVTRNDTRTRPHISASYSDCRLPGCADDEHRIMSAVVSGDFTLSTLGDDDDFTPDATCKAG